MTRKLLTKVVVSVGGIIRVVIDEPILNPLSQHCAYCWRFCAETPTVQPLLFDTLGLHEELEPGEHPIALVEE